MSKLHNRRKERGYTAIELGAAIAGGLIFIAIATFGILRALDNNRYSTLVQMVTAQVPQALVATLSNSGSLVNGLGTAAAGAKTRIEAAGVPADTPWGTPWTVQAAPAAGANQNIITIDFPVGGARAADKVPGVVTRVAQANPMITTASAQPNATAPTGVRVTYNVAN